MSHRESWQRVESAVPHLTLFMKHEGLVVHSELSGSLYGMQGYAAQLFLRRESGEGVDELCAEADSDEAALQIVELLRQYDQILSGDEPGATYQKAASYDKRLTACKEDDDCYHLSGCRFRVVFPNERFRQRIAPQIKHLKSSFSEADIEIEFQQMGALITTLFNGAPMGRPVPEENLFPQLQDWIRIVAYQRNPYLITIHSAGVAKDDKCILLPGASGSGKSTLSAGLMKAGYTLYSDETAVIDTSCNLRSFPMALSVKDGSLEVLSELYPEIIHHSTHQRFDGQFIRYLAPPTESLSKDNAPVRVTHIVFPTYDPDGDGQLNLLTSIDALRLLDVAGYQIEDGLDVAKAEQILNWIDSLRCYTMKFRTLEQAIAAIEAIS